MTPGADHRGPRPPSGFPEAVALPDRADAGSYDALADLFLGDAGGPALTPSARPASILPPSPYTPSFPAPSAPPGFVTPRPNVPRVTPRAITRPAPFPRPFPPLALETVVLGNLPGLAPLWLTQYAKHRAGQPGLNAVAVLRCDEGDLTLDLLLSPAAPPLTQPPPHSGDLAGALAFARAHAAAWLIRCDDDQARTFMAASSSAASAPTIHTCTLLTSADETSVVACYRTLKQLAQDLADGHVLPALRVAILAAPADKAHTAGQRLTKAADTFLGRPLTVEYCGQRLSAGRSATLFSGPLAPHFDSLADVLHYLETLASPVPAPTPVSSPTANRAATSRPAQPQSADPRPPALRLTRPDHDPLPPQIPTFTAPDHELDELAELALDAAQPQPTFDPPAAPILPAVFTSTPPAHLSSDDLAALDALYADPSPLPPPRPAPLRPTTSPLPRPPQPPPAAHVVAPPAAPVTARPFAPAAFAAAAPPAPAAPAFVPPRERVAPFAPAPLAVTPPAAPAALTPPADSLARRMGPFERLDVQCPYAGVVELAVCPNGRLHLLAAAGSYTLHDAEFAVQRLLTARAWVDAHLPLLRRAFPMLTTQPGAATATLHLLTDRPREVRHLLDTDLRLHILTPTPVPAPTSLSLTAAPSVPSLAPATEPQWLCLDLN